MEHTLKQKLDTDMDNEKQKQETLDELGVKYMTDKSSLLHNYLVEYQKEFPEPKKVDRILEIGLQRGSKEWRTNEVSPSLAMWKEFFSEASVFGADIKKLKFNDERVSFFRMDQNSPDDLIRLFNFVPEGLDFILDDGSHIASHQLITFLVLWPKLKKGGVFIIEDLNPVVQQKYPQTERFNSIIGSYLDAQKMDYRWIDSASSGEMNSLIIRKK